MNAGRLPIRCISRAAGMDIAASPTIDIDNGSVASAGVGAMCVPTIPPKVTSVMVLQAANACAIVRVQTCRICGAQYIRRWHLGYADLP
jgi:hypothetical protein